MKRGEARYGILLLLGGTAITLLLLIVLARYPSLFFRGVEYRAVFLNASGLNPGDEVRYGGLLVGAVVDLDFHEDDPTRIIIRFRVRPRTPIRADTRAQITQVGLLGEPFLALHAGSPDAPALEPGSVIVTDPTLSFQDAVSRLASFLDRADTLLTGVERVAGTQPWERVERTLARMEDMVAGAAASSERIFTQVELASARLNVVLDRSDRMLVALDTAIRTGGPEFAQTQREANAAVRELRVLLADLREALHAGPGAAELVRNMSVASEHLARLAARLEHDPASLLQRRDPPRKIAGPPVRD
ncbi:MAG TPA: MlaD family protein [Gemmatimonadaceae bacterium]|nr:MlaD family protein [Gemmatimonadaceae bacterium]